MNERGSGTALVVAVMGALSLFAVLGMFAISIAHAYEQGRAAADLSALAAATALLQGADANTACAAARSVAQRNAAELVTCDLGTDDVRISVRPERVPQFVIRARAGVSGATTPIPAAQ